ncbi:MAG: NAD-dependent epimerase/dehydratase family protein, partial [Kordiimonadaceae bacterium]|nr:NAD-dependent epimerase/dehydratase family protein [Kordiimonadaceae bacterium]
TLTDVRQPKPAIPVGTGIKRSGKRLLTVGTDCAVGKMYTVLALEKAMRARGMDADFRATGQTGIFIAGNGVPIDAVVADFISGAAEYIAPANNAQHWDLIEGQGSLFHPSYAAVTLGLVHGSQPDMMILCHKAGLVHIDQHRDYMIPQLSECILMYEEAARLTNRNAAVVGLSFNTSTMVEGAAQDYLSAMEKTYGLPCFDPVRTGVERMVDYIQDEKQEARFYKLFPHKQCVS